VQATGMGDLLPSQEKEYKNKIKELIEEKKMIYAAALRRVTAIINLSRDLSEAQKADLIEMIWEE
jgi:uncharacterized tellurite resistance protein B-like protein